VCRKRTGCGRGRALPDVEARHGVARASDGRRECKSSALLALIPRTARNQIAASVPPPSASRFGANGRFIHPLPPMPQMRCWFARQRTGYSGPVPTALASSWIVLQHRMARWWRELLPERSATAPPPAKGGAIVVARRRSGHAADVPSPGGRGPDDGRETCAKPAPPHWNRR
jgi:hypothetical protein